MKHLTRNVCDGCAVWCQFDPSDWERTARENPTYASNEHESVHLPKEADCRSCLEKADLYGEDCLSRLALLSLATGELTPWE